MNYKYKYIKYKKKYLELKYIKLPDKETTIINVRNNVPEKKFNLEYFDGNKICVTRKTAKDIAIFNEKENVIIIPNPAEYILYHDQRTREKCIKLRKINRTFYDEFVKSRKKYDERFKKQNNELFYSETSGMVDLHKMYPDYKYLYENIKEKTNFIKLRLELNNVLEQLYNNTNNCFFITPNDIKNFDIKNFSNFTNSSFILHEENTKKRLEDVSKVTEEDKNMLVSNYDNLMYMFKNALKDNSIYCKGNFNKAVDDNIVKRLYGFDKVNVFYHFIIFFQELHRIKELSEEQNKYIIINDSISIKIITNNIRQYLIDNIDNIREYFFKEYSKDFEDKTELLDNIYLIDYIIYKMDVVYNDIIGKLKKGGVYRYIMSIIDEFKKLTTPSIFEDYLDGIKSYTAYIIPQLRSASRLKTSQKSQNKTFVENAKLFVDNVCPMELKISIMQEEFDNSYCSSDIKYTSPYYFEFKKEKIPQIFINIHKKISKLKLKNRPLILGTKIYTHFKRCAKSYIVSPWGSHNFNKKLSWNIDINKWMVSCLMKRKQDIKGIIVHKNPNEKDTYEEKKVYMRISMFNERKELNLEMKNFIGCMIHKLKDENTNKFYISYLFNKKSKRIRYYNSRSSQLYAKDLLSEAYSNTYIELNTILYYCNDIGEKLYFYLYKYNNDNNIIILISTKTIDELKQKYSIDIIELKLIKTDTLKDFIFIKK